MHDPNCKKCQGSGRQFKSGSERHSGWSSWTNCDCQPPRPCGNHECKVSTGIHDGLTFGSGELDENGFWSKPCGVCAREYERLHPEEAPCWPFAEQNNG
jgi:hypothetical protein